ncbi:glycoside hydrolase family 5 protein [Calocera cornea HHB12733]|uniref:mannan endo-1,4-beta-mannosidase n=1 Tax=Calocera cornea HHB12733 TaxID=1353952 RepID=A0A165F2G8_9BASI|nr:glycoside hydrolase family 5 protein [Calocera cornea HHB12733]
MHVILLLLSLLPFPLALALSHPHAAAHAQLKRHGLHLRQDILHGLLTGPGPFPQDPPWVPDYPTTFDGFCAPNSSQTVGTFAGPTLPSITDLLKRGAFVERSGTGLKLLGEDFRMVGTNVYWLGLDENVIPDPSYPSKTRVIEVMGIVSAMRGTVIRAHTLGISFGNPLSVMPGPDTFNEAAYEPIDFAILMARIYGIKLQIPLVDNYNWYHGGKYQFIGWAGIPWSGTGAAITPPDVGAYFYNTSSIVDSFKAYITHHLNHVNQYTGIAYKDDPTILGWETGNELAAVLFNDGPAPPAWTAEIAGLIKSIAPKHLVVDGTYGFYPETGQLQVSQIDIFSDHFYPPSIARFQAGLALTQAADRVYLAGEWDWTGQFGGDTINDFTAALEAGQGVGDFFWSLFGHDDKCCLYVEHNDGYSFYYPGRTQDMHNKALVMVQHAYNMNQDTPPEVVPAVACPQYSFPDSLFPSGLNIANLGL